MQVENYLDAQIRELGVYIEAGAEYSGLYSGFSHPKLQIVLSALHARIITLYKTMNQLLPTDQSGAHFWADPSRELISTIDMINGLQRNLKSTPYSFQIVGYYERLIIKCKGFLNQYRGSQIPVGMEKIELYYMTPIFIPDDRIKVSRKDETCCFQLHLIGGVHMHKYLNIRTSIMIHILHLNGPRVTLMKKSCCVLGRNMTK